MGGVFVEVVDLARVEEASGATDLLIQAGHVEVLIFVVNVVVDSGAEAVGSEQGGFTVVLIHLAEHGVHRVEAVVINLVLLVVDLNVLIAIVDGSVQGHTLRTVGAHRNLGAVAENDRPLLALPVLQVLAVQIFVGVAPVLQNVLSGRVFYADGVLIHRHLVSTAGGVRDRFTLTVLAELTLTATVTPRRMATATRRAVMAEVEVHVHVVVTRRAPVRHSVVATGTRRTVVATHVRAPKVVSVGRRIARGVAVMGMMVMSVVGLVVAHRVAQQSPYAGSDKTHKGIAATQDSSDQTTRQAADQPSISRAEDTVAAATEAAAPSSLGNIGVKESISVNDRHTKSLL